MFPQKTALTVLQSWHRKRHRRVDRFTCTTASTMLTDLQLKKANLIVLPGLQRKLHQRSCQFYTYRKVIINSADKQKIFTQHVELLLLPGLRRKHTVLLGFRLNSSTSISLILMSKTSNLVIEKVHFSSRWYQCARKSPYALHPVSQKFPQRCLWNGSSVCLTDDGPLSPFQRRSSSASSFHTSLLQAIDDVMSLALCQHVVSQTSLVFSIELAKNVHSNTG